VRKSSQHDDQVLDELDDHVPTDQMAQGLSSRSRRLLHVMTLCTLLLSVAVASPWWLPLVQHTFTVLFPPPPYSGSLIYGEYGGKVSALRTSDGRVQWTQNDFFATDQYIVIPDMLIFAGIYHGTPSFVGIQPTSGRLIWHTPSPHQYNSPYFTGTSDNRVYIWFPSPDGVLLPLFESLDASTGTPFWSAPINGDLAGTPPSGVSLLVFCTSTEPGKVIHLIARNAVSGTIRWVRQGPFIDGSNGVGCYQSGMISFLAVMHRASTSLYAYSLIDGRLLWQREVIGGVTGWDATTIYVSTSSRATAFPAQQMLVLTALDSKTGHMLWQSLGDYSDLSAYAFDKGISIQPYYFVKSLLGVAALSSLTGKLLWQVDLPDNQNQGWNALFDGYQTLYYVGSTTLYAFDGASGQIRWHSSLPIAELGDGLMAIQADLYHIYLLGGDGITARDGATGQILWHNVQPYNLLFFG